MPLTHVDGDNCPCCIANVAIIYQHLHEWSPALYLTFLGLCEINPLPDTQPMRGLIEDMIVMSNVMNGTPGREWQCFEFDGDIEGAVDAPAWVMDIVAKRKPNVEAGMRAANYVKSLEERIIPQGSEGTVDDRGWIQPPTLQGCQSRSEFVVKQYKSRGY